MIKKFVVRVPDPYGTPSLVVLCVMVMDESDFDGLVSTIEGIDDGNFISQTGKVVTMDTGAIGKIRDAKILPMVARGTKTEFLFAKYEIDEKYFSAIVRGTGSQLLEGLKKSVQMSMSMRANAQNN